MSARYTRKGPVAPTGLNVGLMVLAALNAGMALHAVVDGFGLSAGVNGGAAVFCTLTFFLSYGEE